MFYRIFLLTLCFSLSFKLEASCLYSSSVSEVGDTLIIDGEIIYIEQNEVVLQTDSVVAPSNGLQKVGRHIFSATCAFGMNVTAARFSSVNPDLTPLNNFMGVTKRTQINAMTGLDLGVRFLTIKGATGSIELTAATGFNFNRIRAAYTALREPSELAVDSIIAFDGTDGDLALTYFTITAPPDIGEVDTLYPRLNKTMLQFDAMEFAGKLRATLNRGARSVRWFAETGVIQRYLKVREDGSGILLVNETGEWILVPSASIRGKTVLVPHFALGAEKRIQSSHIKDGTFFTLGACVNASIPSATISQNDYFSLEAGNVGLSFYGRVFF